MKQEHESRGVRLGQITDVLRESDKGMTMAQTARAIGLKPSTHVRKMLWELVYSDVLTFSVVTHRPNVDKTLFYHKSNVEYWQYPLPLEVA